MHFVFWLFSASLSLQGIYKVLADVWWQVPHRTNPCRLRVHILSISWGFTILLNTKRTNPNERSSGPNSIPVHFCHVSWVGALVFWHVQYNLSDLQHRYSVLWVTCVGFARLCSSTHVCLHGNVSQADSCTWFREIIVSLKQKSVRMYTEKVCSDRILSLNVWKL